MAKIGEAVRLNRRVILAQDSLVDNNVMGWVPDTDIMLPEYLFHASRTVRLAEISHATTLPSVRKTDVVRLLIPVPPLDDQRQIVETLSGLKRRLDFGESLLATVSETMRALVRSFYRDLGLGLQDLPNGWERRKLAEIAECKLGKMLDSQKNKGTARPYLRNISVQWGRFHLSDLKEMRIKEDEIERFEVRPGDLLMCEGGEPGRCAIWDRDEQVFFQKALHRIRPTEAVLATYLQRYFAFSAQAGILERHFTGTTIKHLPGRDSAARD
jgi:type I restriction enzyme S subunit